MSQRENNIPQGPKKPIPAEFTEFIEGSAVLGIRVPLAHYIIYRKQLTGREQEQIREILRSTFEKLVEDRDILKPGSQTREINVPVKINVFEKIEDSEILKIKKMIDKYEKEIAKCTEDKASLMEENDSLKKKIEELETQLNQTQVQLQDRKIEERLNMLIEWLITAYYCIEYSNECKREDVKKNIMIILYDHKVDNEVFERVRMRFTNLYTRKT